MRPEERAILDQMFEIRVNNNVPWRRIIEIAIEYAPPEVVGYILNEINENDLRVSKLLKSLLSKVTRDEETV